MKRLGRWRWRCELCAGFGFTATDEDAFAEFQKHYQDKHMTKESK